MRYVTEILNWVSGSFMLPDIVLLLAAMVFALIELGGFCSTWLTLLRHRRKREAIMELLRRDQRIEPGMLGQGVFARHLQELAAMNWDEIHCEKLIFDFSQNYEHELERAKFMMKIGPMLGLMGTLIPMGPALAGLASGDVASMAYNMQIAFATTVVGLVAGAVGFLTQQVKQRWYLQDMTNLEFISELLNDKRSIHKTSEK